MKANGYVEYHLFAEYNEDSFGNPDYKNGTKRLVKFYEKVGFERINSGDLINGSQVDMELSL